MFLVTGGEIMVSFLTLSSLFSYVSLNCAVTVSNQHLGHVPNSFSFTVFVVVDI